MNKKTTVLFDFDGTIANSLPRLLEISNSFAEEYGYRQVREDEIQLFREKTTLQTFRELKVPLLKVPTIARKVKQAFRREAHLSQPYQGIKPLLAHLNPSYQLGILTSNTRQNVQQFLHQHQLEHFSFIYTSSNIFGKARVLKRILREKKLSVSEMIYVGDELRDVNAARQIGMDVIAVSWGANTKKALAMLRPTYLVDKPTEIIPLLI